MVDHTQNGKQNFMRDFLVARGFSMSSFHSDTPTPLFNNPKTLLGKKFDTQGKNTLQGFLLTVINSFILITITPLPFHKPLWPHHLKLVLLLYQVVSFLVQLTKD
jgi:hypothetical protein